MNEQREFGNQLADMLRKYREVEEILARIQAMAKIAGMEKQVEELSKRIELLYGGNKPD